MTSQSVEVWYQHLRCGAVFQESGHADECVHCTGKGVKVDLARHEFKEGSLEFIAFLKAADRVYTSSRLTELTKLVTSVAPQTTSP